MTDGRRPAPQRGGPGHGPFKEHVRPGTFQPPPKATSRPYHAFRPRGVVLSPVPGPCSLRASGPPLATILLLHSPRIDPCLQVYCLRRRAGEGRVRSMGDPCHGRRVEGAFCLWRGLLALLLAKGRVAARAPSRGPSPFQTHRARTRTMARKRPGSCPANRRA
jgi:hypothetical protein